MVRARGAAVVLVSMSLVGACASPASADPAAHASAIAGVALHPWRFGPAQTPLPFWPLRDPTARERAFAALQAMGIRQARVDLRWDQVERINGIDDWTEFDGIHSSAIQHRVTLLPVVAMPPPWANHGRGVWSFPDRASDFERFLTAALTRYPDIPAWEIWNEPNLPSFSQPGVDPAKFVALLAAAHDAKARAHSSAQIVSGGLSPTGPGARQFFEDMIRLHAFDYVDGFGIHAYSPAAPDERGSFFLRLPTYRERLLQIGKPNVGVWITEYGAPTSTQASVYGPPLGDAEQAARLRSAFALAARWPWVQNLTWYEFEDECADPNDVRCNFGLVHRDMSQKPATGAMTDVVHGRIGAITSRIRLTRVRVQHRRRGHSVQPLLFVRGTLETPGASQAVGPVTLTLAWSTKRAGEGRNTRALRVGVRSGRFTKLVARPASGYWRAVAEYPGSPDYQASRSQRVTVAVRAPH